MYTPTRTCVYVLVSLYDISISIGLSIYYYYVPVPFTASVHSTELDIYRF